MMLCSLIVLSLQIFASCTKGEKINDPTLNFNALSWGGGAYEIHDQVSHKTIADRDKIAEVWFKNTWSQRNDIEDTYNVRFCPELTATGQKYHGYYCPLGTCFDRISTGDLKGLYESSRTRPEGILARTIRNTIEGKLKEMGAIEEIACANDSEMKDKIADFYLREFPKMVESDLAKFREEDKEYTKVMTTYCWTGFCQEKKLNVQDADKEAKALRDTDPGQNKEAFRKKLIQLLEKQYCEPDLKIIFQKYRKDKDGIDNAVDKAFDVERQKRAYNVLVRYIEDTCLFYANQLDSAMDGAGTNERRLNRIVLTRSERDLGCILKKYEEIYGMTFQDRLKEDSVAEGRYCKAIGFLCGG